MQCQEIFRISLVSDYKAVEFSDPSECSLTLESIFIDFFVEMALSASFDFFAIAFVLINIRNRSMIPACFPGIFGIKSGIGIEESALDVEPKSFYIFGAFL